MAKDIVNKGAEAVVYIAKENRGLKEYNIALAGSIYRLKAGEEVPKSFADNCSEAQKEIYLKKA